jgi:hypothetical protein
LPLPADISPVESDFYLELRRMIDLAGLTCRSLQMATSSDRSESGEPSFYSKSRWGRWINGQSQPPRKAIKKLAEKLADDEISADHLLDLWDRAFAPAPEAAQPTQSAQASQRQRPESLGIPESSESDGQPTGPAVSRAEPAPSQLGHAADRLATLVAEECATALNDRVLRGWEPLVVRWWPDTGPSADPQTADEILPGHTGSIGPLKRHIQYGHRLVVLGPGGAGKTTLATLLMAELLADHRAEDPVPVLVSAASLAASEMVKSWLERTLTARFPALRDTRAYGANAINDLIARHRVLPVVDGLDDLAPEARGRLLDALSRAFGRSQPLIVTCRTEEYHETVAISGHVLPDAALIELQPVNGEDAARFLERGTTGPRAENWQPVIAAIRSDPACPLAKTLSSPLMVGLVRSIYADHGQVMAAWLTDTYDQDTIENEILKSIISARFRSRATSQDARPEQPWSAQDANRWLTFLAAHLTSLRTYDLDWARLRYALPAFTSPSRRSVLSAALAWILAGTIFGLSRALAFGPAQGLRDGIAQGLDAALVVGAIFLLAPLPYPAIPACPPWLTRLRQLTRTAPATALAIPVLYALESGLRDGIGADRAHGVLTGILHGLTAAALNWMVAATLIWLATHANLFDLVEKPVYFSLRMPGRGAALARTLLVGLAWGAGLGLVVGYAVKILSDVLAHEHPLWGLGVPAGAVLGTAFALIRWGRTPSASAPAANPVSTLRADRSLVLILAVPFLLVVPAFFGTAFASGSHNWSHNFIRFGLYGLGIGLTIWLAVALSHAWPQYLISTAWLAARGKLPWRLASFLNEAYELEILRQQGGAYQFRHARLQDHLAEVSTPLTPMPELTRAEQTSA